MNMTVSIPEPARILLIDSYDSFTHNLAALCRQSIPDCHIHIVKNNDISTTSLATYLDYFSAVIIGPGPGSPENLDDIGVVRDIWKVADEHLLPVFGVCLGLQSLAVEFGAALKRLNVVKHGQISQILHEGTEIFKGVGEVAAVRYHSLHVDLRQCREVEVLAWADDGEENGRVVMAAKHKTRPFWAVQYHPESVCTSGGGVEVLRNFWRLATNWSTIRRRKVRPWDQAVEAVVGLSWRSPQVYTTPPAHSPHSLVTTRILELPGIVPTSVCEVLGVADEASDFALLESAAQPGRFSIIGCLDASTPKVTHFVGETFVQVSTEEDNRSEDLGSLTIWAWLARFMRNKKAQGGVRDIPFWGGLVGYLSYELGVHALSASIFPRSKAGERHPDVNLVFVERSIVIDAGSGKVYVQSLRSDDTAWLDKTSLSLKQCARAQTNGTRTSPAKRRRKSHSTPPPVVTLPDREQYISRINQAKEHLFAGDSYELCLTAPTRISVPRSSSSSNAERGCSSWELYKVLRARNPAPHSAYLRLHPSTLLSSSPERFLSFSRPPHTTCQLRPIKGTVRKAPGITRAVAEQALAGSTKEVAENLMIVDLIRHDLHGVVGEDVVVKQFCKVEEYKTVWQLVSVIEGKLSTDEGRRDVDLGWEVLQRSLPPGSMTGAPKKRSVEILQDLEDSDRGIYSGVFGYWCVGGGGDWSVTIRSCFKHDKRDVSAVHTGHGDSTRNSPDTEEWTLGAGGAITALSDPEAEWEEMMVKVESVIRAFGDVNLS